MDGRKEGKKEKELINEKYVIKINSGEGTQDGAVRTTQDWSLR